MPDSVVNSPAKYISAPTDLSTALAEWTAVPALAVDTEANSLHSYTEHTSLVQISTRQADYIIDPIALPDLSSVAPLFADAAIEKVGLTGITGLSKGEVTRLDLSAGQRRRLALAIALLEDRDFLILDEFVADQDYGQREFFFRSLLPELKARGKTLLVSTHDLHWADCCDRLVRFEGGRLTEVAAPGATAGEAA